MDVHVLRPQHPFPPPPNTPRLHSPTRLPFVCCTIKKIKMLTFCFFHFSSSSFFFPPFSFLFSFFSSNSVAATSTRFAKSKPSASVCRFDCVDKHWNSGHDSCATTFGSHIVESQASFSQKKGGDGDASFLAYGS